MRPALAVSFVWALGVWVIGEGLGMLLTGTASALTGAPGSVLIYGLIGLMAWPRPARRWVDWSDRPAGVASSAAAQGIGRTSRRWPCGPATGRWPPCCSCCPTTGPPRSIQSAIVGMADGAAELVRPLPHRPRQPVLDLGDPDGLDPRRRSPSSSASARSWPAAPGWFLAAGALFSFLLWIAGQGLVGNLFNGSDTDPNTGPLVILLAAAMVPTVIASKEAWRSPAGEIVRRSPAAAIFGVAALGAALALSASYPVAAPESTDSAMAGMVMSGGGSGGGGGTTAAAGSPSATASTCVPHQKGLKIAGLDLANTPYMIMSGSNGMDMNGADASAAAGFNTTTPNWRYDGPALPQAEAQALLTDGNNGPIDIHMAQSGCAPALTAAQDIGAAQYVQATSAAVTPYATPAAAVAAGYVPASPTNYPIVNYVNPTIVAANAAAKRTLDPHACRRPRLRDDAVGHRGARRRHVHPSVDCDQRADALRRARAVAPPHPGVRSGHAVARPALRHHRVPAVPERLGAAADALRVHGVAGPCGGRPAGDPAARHPDGGGGRDAAERHVGCVAGMSHRDERPLRNSASGLIRRAQPGS